MPVYLFDYIRDRKAYLQYISNTIMFTKLGFLFLCNKTLKEVCVILVPKSFILLLLGTFHVRDVKITHEAKDFGNCWSKLVIFFIEAFKMSWGWF